MQNFYTPPDLINGTTAVIEGGEHRHATRSCRVRIDEVIGVTDGCGRRFYARIESIEHHRLTAVIEQDMSGVGEPDGFITLALAAIMPARFETAVEKCTELGVRRIIPIESNRCERGIVRRLKRDRLARIALNSAKQSGRSWIPEISEPEGLMHLIQQGSGRLFAAFMSADCRFEEAWRGNGCPVDVILVVGPEGDFDGGEYRALREAGAVFFSLGGLTLRSETAAIAATAAAAGVLQRERTGSHQR